MSNSKPVLVVDAESNLVVAGGKPSDRQVHLLKMIYLRIKKEGLNVQKLSLICKATLNNFQIICAMFQHWPDSEFQHQGDSLCVQLLECIKKTIQDLNSSEAKVLSWKKDVYFMRPKLGRGNQNKAKIAEIYLGTVNNVIREMKYIMQWVKKVVNEPEEKHDVICHFNVCELAYLDPLAALNLINSNNNYINTVRRCIQIPGTIVNAQELKGLDLGELQKVYLLILAIESNLEKMMFSQKHDLNYANDVDDSEMDLTDEEGA